MVGLKKISSLAAVSAMAITGTAASLQPADVSHAHHLLSHRSLAERHFHRQQNPSMVKVQKRLIHAISDGLGGIIGGLGKDLDRRGLIGDVFGGEDRGGAPPSSSASPPASTSRAPSNNAQPASSNAPAPSRPAASNNSAPAPAPASSRPASNTQGSNNSRPSSASSATTNNNSSNNNNNNNNSNSNSNNPSNNTANQNSNANSNSDNRGSAQQQQAAAAGATGASSNSDRVNSASAAAASASASAAVASAVSAAAASQSINGAAASAAAATLGGSATSATGATGAAAATGVNRANSSGSSSGSDGTTKVVVPIVVIAAAVAVIAIAWTVIRRIRKRKAEHYDPRLQPVEQTYHHRSMVGGPPLAAGGAALAVGGAAYGLSRERSGRDSYDSYRGGRPMSALTEEEADFPGVQPPMEEVASFAAVGSARGTGRLRNYGSARAGQGDEHFAPADRVTDSMYVDDLAGPIAVGGAVTPFSDEHGAYDVNYYDGSTSAGYNNRAARGMDAAGTSAAGRPYSPYADLQRAEAADQDHYDYDRASSSRHDPFADSKRWSG